MRQTAWSPIPDTDLVPVVLNCPASRLFSQLYRTVSRFMTAARYIALVILLA